MIQWVYEAAKQCDVISEVVVATDHEEIAAVISQAGGKAMLTPVDIATGSDRVALVAAHYPDMDVVINLQGDEPFIQPNMLKQLVAPYLNGDLPPMTTLAYPLDFNMSYQNPNFVKVITDAKHNAIYFSRAPIPHFRHSVSVPVYHHIGLYAFTRDFLLQYTQLNPTPLEQAEGLEQLRAIEHGYKIRVCLTQQRTLEINTPEEFSQAQNFVFENT
jgi:3-deoxy-manno-octulosonate cytidylyltransferase (CMP-KDO synthetase)